MNFVEVDLSIPEMEFRNFLNLNIPYKKTKKVKEEYHVERALLYDEVIDDLYNNEYWKVKSNSLTDDESPVINYFIFSDGGSFNNGRKKADLPVFGSKCTIIYQGKECLINNFHSAHENVTNNWCEVTAGLDGLDFLNDRISKSKTRTRIIMSSDSQYLMVGINDWLEGWKARNWKNNEGQTIANINEWMKINEYLSKFDIYTCWVKGHQVRTESTSMYKSFKDFIIENNGLCDTACDDELNLICKEHGVKRSKK